MHSIVCRALAVTFLLLLVATGCSDPPAPEARVEPVLAPEAVATEQEVTIQCMKAHGFDIDAAALENPGVIPDTLSAGEAERYQEALFGRLDTAQPDIEQIELLAEQVRSSFYDPAYNCLDLARWYHRWFTAPPALASESFDPIDPDDDVVLSQLSVDFQICVSGYGVSGPYGNPNELLLELQYLEYVLQSDASAPAVDPDAPPLPVDDTTEPLDSAQLEELDALRAADFGCSGDYYDAYATRVNELNEAPA